MRKLFLIVLMMSMFVFGSGDTTKFYFNYSKFPVDCVKTIILKNDTTSVFELDDLIDYTIPINWDKETYPIAPFIFIKKEDSLPKIKMKIYK